MLIVNKNLRFIFLVLILAELLSFAGYLWPFLNTVLFIAIAVLVLILSLVNLEYGILFLLAELIIGSKGYLFFLDLGGTQISIRIAFWLIVLSVWLSKLIVKWINEKKFPRIEFFFSKFLYFYLALFVFIAWGIVNGLISHNSLSNIFFDFNNWLYLALILPFYDTVISGSKEFFHKMIRVFFASAIWLSIKTFILLYIFSHNIIGLVLEVYRWVRDSGVGEITLVQGGFYRVFFQSHIYALALFLVSIYWLVFQIGSVARTAKKDSVFIFFLTSVLMATNLISFSRSNWIGLASGMLFIGLMYLKNRDWRKIGWLILTSALSGLAALIIIIIVVKFPYPNPVGGFNTASLLSERASQLTGEAGVSSRWSLLPELWQPIRSHIFFGSGFGKTVTYISQDPRVLETNSKGEYTTYAFEWGWLDIWLKLGIFGLLSYLSLVAILIFYCLGLYKIIEFESIFSFGLLAGFIGIIVLNFFSPYMNHPLGLGYLMLLSVSYEKIKLLYPHLR